MKSIEKIFTHVVLAFALFGQLSFGSHLDRENSESRGSGHLFFKDLPKYQHINVENQFREYEEIYAELSARSKTQMQVIKDLSSEALRQILKSRGFRLWRDFICHNGRSDRRVQALGAMEDLYNYTLNKEDFLVSDFWHINLIAALLIDWQKGLLTGYTIQGQTDESMPLVFEKIKRGQVGENFLKEEDPYGSPSQYWPEIKLNFKKNINNPLKNENFSIYYKFSGAYIVYTDRSSSISEERISKYLLKYPTAVFTVFDPHLTLLRRGRFDQEGNKYQPHDGSIGATGNYISHDFEHAKVFSKFISSHKYDVYLNSVFNFFLELKNDLGDNNVAKNEYVKNGCFFLTHEIANMLSFISSYGVESIYNYEKFFDKLEIKNKNSSLKPLAYILNEIGHLMAELIGKNYSNNLSSRNYKILMRDWELMLHRKIPSMKNMAQEDSIKFTFQPLHDAAQGTLIPSLDELLEQAQARDKGLVLDKTKNKVAQWKSIDKSLRLELKKEALMDAYRNFWSTLSTIILEYQPGAILKDEYLAIYNLLISDDKTALLNVYKNDLLKLNQLINDLPLAARTKAEQKINAVKDQGQIRGLGSNDYGQLGLGDTVNSSRTPVPISGLPLIQAVAAGSCDSIFIDCNRGLLTFGGHRGYCNPSSWGIPSTVLGDSRVMLPRIKRGLKTKSARDVPAEELVESEVPQSAPVADLGGSQSEESIEAPSHPSSKNTPHTPFKWSKKDTVGKFDRSYRSKTSKRK